MITAIEMAEKAMRNGEVPVGAVLVYEDRIIARAYNRMNDLGTPLAHAEILVLMQGMKKLHTKYLQQCHLYVTLQPCAFCTQALILSRIGRVYFGAYDTSSTLGENFDSIGGIHEQSCQDLLKQFFHQQRVGI